MRVCAHPPPDAHLCSPTARPGEGEPGGLSLVVLILKINSRMKNRADNNKGQG